MTLLTAVAMAAVAMVAVLLVVVAKGGRGPRHMRNAVRLRAVAPQHVVA